MAGGARGERSDRDESFWALRDVDLRDQAGRGRRHHRPERRRQEHAAQDPLAHHRADATGYARRHRAVGSLLEVGTGFHPELTGRENIFLNGAILGMKRAEIQRKFDEIVAFAEVEKFLDTPVKRYSSGMYVRLAFAVAAHLEPEILLVDEVLAVGDARFQKKCLSKMEDVGHGGRTVHLRVATTCRPSPGSASAPSCSTAGASWPTGRRREIVSSYLRGGLGTTAAREWSDIRKAPGGEFCRLRGIRAKTRAGSLTDTVDIRHPVGIEMDFEVLKPGYHILPHFFLWNEDGVQLLGANDLDPEWRGRRRPAGRYVTTAWIPGTFSRPGRSSSTSRSSPSTRSRRRSGSRASSRSR